MGLEPASEPRVTPAPFTEHLRCAVKYFANKCTLSSQQPSVVGRYSHPHCSEVEAKTSESLGKSRLNVLPCDSWPLSVAMGVRGDWQSQWDSLLTETGVPGCG